MKVTVASKSYLQVFCVFTNETRVRSTHLIRFDFNSSEKALFEQKIVVLASIS